MSAHPPPPAPARFPLTRRRFVAGLAAAAAVGRRAAAQDRPAAHPLGKALKYARLSLTEAEKVPSYTAVFEKRETVNGKPVGGRMQVKFRREPFSVYMRFLNPENEGRQVLYVAGRNDGKLMVRETGLKGLVGTVSLRPDDPMILSESRHTITSMGMANLARQVIDQWEAETRFGEVDVNFYGKADLAGRPAVVIEAAHPVPRREFPYARTRLWLDRETKLPVRVQQWAFGPRGGEPVPVGDYTYTQVRTDVQLTARDFDRRTYRL